MDPQFLTRQADLLPADRLGCEIHVIGAGAIGSFTVLQLAKLGFENITVYDDDTVSPENMNSQFFRIGDIGKPKVVALLELVKDFTGVEIKVKFGRYEGGKLSGIVITAVDSMAARRLVFQEHALKSALTRVILDPRMGAESLALQVYEPGDEEDVKGYEATLYTDEAAEQQRCTAKSTMYTVNLISGLVAKTVKDLVMHETRIRSFVWDIKTSQLMVWDSRGMNPNQMPIPAQPERFDPGSTSGIERFIEASYSEANWRLTALSPHSRTLFRNMLDFSREESIELHGPDADERPLEERRNEESSPDPRRVAPSTAPDPTPATGIYRVPVDGRYEVRLSTPDGRQWAEMHDLRSGDLLSAPFLEAQQQQHQRQQEANRMYTINYATTGLTWSASGSTTAQDIYRMQQQPSSPRERGRIDASMFREAPQPALQGTLSGVVSAIVDEDVQEILNRPSPPPDNNFF